MSGGVDSSVAACLLLDKGYEVEGAFMKFYNPRRWGPLTPQDSPLKDAKKIAKKLGIKLHIMDFRKEFKKQVVDYFLDSYARGYTPNPCVQCNKYIKFGEFLKRAKKLGFDYIATGHYVKLTPLKTGRAEPLLGLSVAKDKTKDQSYFLWTLTQAQLKHCLFPIGNYTKSEVRAIARKKIFSSKLKELAPRSFSEGGESQGLCFIKDKRHYDFLRRHLKLKPGPIITLDGVPKKGTCPPKLEQGRERRRVKPGSVIGQHQGLPLYTIGQRREILIGGIGPFFVVKLDYKHNTLEVANKFDKSLLFKKELTAKKVNWVSGKAPKFPFTCKTRIRYLHPTVNCTVVKSGNKLCVKFKKPQRAVTPGQSVVFYQGKEMLGGGAIGK